MWLAIVGYSIMTTRCCGVDGAYLPKCLRSSAACDVRRGMAMRPVHKLLRTALSL